MCEKTKHNLRFFGLQTIQYVNQLIEMEKKN